MYISITGAANNKDVYINQSYRKENGKTSSKIYRKLGKYNDLLEQFSGNHEQLMKWAKEEAAKDTKNYSVKNQNVSISLSQTTYIPKNEERSFNVGYLFLQKICTDLRIDNICQKTDITDHLHQTYGFHTDYEFLSKSSMRSIIKNTKTISSILKGYLQQNYK